MDKLGLKRSKQVKMGQKVVQKDVWRGREESGGPYIYIGLKLTYMELKLNSMGQPQGYRGLVNIKINIIWYF